MLNVQRFLIEQKEQGKFTTECFNALTEQLGIKVKFYDDEGIVLLDYHMIDSPKMHPIVIECRSLILDTFTFEVVSRKFDRFFNYGEALEYYHDFDLPRSVIMEKADGSLIGVYNHNGKWHISTRGMAFAEGEHAMGGTFRDKVLEAFEMNEEQFQESFNTFYEGITFIFEYTSPENRIVTKYEKPEMVFLGATWIGMENYGNYDQELYALQWAGIPCREVKTYSASDMDEVVKLANSLPDLQEGFVIYDPISNKRMKVKSSLYVVAHSIRGNDPLPTKKNLLRLLFTGELDEFIAYFPEWKEKAIDIEKEVEQALEKLANAWGLFKNLESQKDFAIAIKDVKYNGLLFQARKTNTTLQDVWDHYLSVDKKISMFEKEKYANY